MVRHERKVVVRLLPPTLKEAEFFQQLAQYYPGDGDDANSSLGYTHYYVEGRPQTGVYDSPEFSRCYFRFTTQLAHDDFLQKVSHQVFTEPTTGDTMEATIDNALYHKMPQENGKANGDTTSEASSDAISAEAIMPLESHPLYQQFLKDPDLFDIKQLAEDQRREKLKQKRKRLQEKAKAKLKKKKEERKLREKQEKQEKLDKQDKTDKLDKPEKHDKADKLETKVKGDTKPSDASDTTAGPKKKRRPRKKKPTDGAAASAPASAPLTTLSGLVPSGPASALSELKPRPKKAPQKKPATKPKKGTNANAAATNAPAPGSNKPKPKLNKTKKPAKPAAAANPAGGSGSGPSPASS